jgi:hypothetical protein
MILNLGVDFGTSSTKVFCRNPAARRDQQLSVLWFGKDGENVSIPSTLRIREGKVWCGHKAEALRGGQALRSLKVCVACSEGAITCRCRTDGCDAQQGGRLAIDTPEGQQLVPAGELCAILIAGLLHEAASAALEQAGSKHLATLIVNVAAPLDQVKHDPLGDVFEQVLGYATALRGKIVNGMSWKAARYEYQQVAGRPLPSREARTFHFFPEAIAAIHAYSKSPTAAEGLYALVDVGAGTTAVSFFRLGNPDQDRPIVFYASHTEIVGADDMDAALSTAFRTKYPNAPPDCFDSRSAVRAAKESFSTNGLIAIGEYVLTSAEGATALNPVFDRIFGVYQKGARSAFFKEQRSSHWQKLTLVLVGGGTLVPGLATRLLAPPQSFIEDRSIQALSLPSDLVSADKVLPVTLLAVGFGLSFVANDIPDYWHPGEVDPLDPNRPEPGRPRDTWGEDQV